MAPSFAPVSAGRCDGPGSCMHTTARFHGLVAHATCGGNSLLPSRSDAVAVARLRASAARRGRAAPATAAVLRRQARCACALLRSRRDFSQVSRALKYGIEVRTGDSVGTLRLLTPTSAVLTPSSDPFIEYGGKVEARQFLCAPRAPCLEFLPVVRSVDCDVRSPRTGKF